jgi:hypothetical protein
MNEDYSRLESCFLALTSPPVYGKQALESVFELFN